MAILQDKEDLLLILEGRVDLDEEGVVDLCEDVSFHHNSFDLVLLFDVFLLHGLDGEELSGVLPADEDDLGVGALPDDGKHGVGVQRARLLHCLDGSTIIANSLRHVNRHQMTRKSTVVQGKQHRLQSE